MYYVAQYEVCTVHIHCVLAFWQINILLFRLLSIIHHHSLPQATLTNSWQLPLAMTLTSVTFTSRSFQLLQTVAFLYFLNIINSSEYDYYYCMIVLLVKFTLFVAFLILMSAIYLVNKDYYYRVSASASVQSSISLYIHNFCEYRETFWQSGWSITLVFWAPNYAVTKFQGEPLSASVK